MNALGKRLDALEQIARDAQRREMREMIVALPDAHDLTPGEVEEATDEAIRCLDQVTEWRREGLTERQIMQRWADESSVSVDVLYAECRALMETR